jgi:hypothetical protein
MKGQISRDSHRPAQRYSGVYHVQGGMITDADLDERTDIVKHRADALGDDAVRDGCPAIGGAIDVSGATPTLREGDIYADGVRGEFRMPGAGAAPSLAEAMEQQVDFPGAPGLTGGNLAIYADIWERPVFPLEDPYLADPGLHGAETGYRSRTMCQIKSAPFGHANDIEAGAGRYPRIGTATLAVAEHDPETTIDDCDPCANVVSADLTVSNTLFRLEVVRVHGPADNPSVVELAWSAENAAFIVPAGTPSDAVERAGAVYERYSTETECHMGALSNSNAIETSDFVDDLDTGGTGGMPFIRRWDGWAELKMSPGTVSKKLGTGFNITFDGTDVNLTVDTFDATLALGGRSVLRGDYWLVEMRTFAPATERIRLVSATPVGILHHYCVLFRSDGGVGKPLSDAERRKLSFPALSDLPADHVGFENNCPKLYNDAENVQEALDELCSISADDIAFDNNCPRLYDEATNVQEAFDNLCKVDFNIEIVLRLLMDWGIVCGLTARLLKAGSSVVHLAPGWFLDRAGRLAQFDGGDVDIFNLFKQMATGAQNEAAEHLAKGALCLTVAVDDARKVSLHLVHKSRAFGPPDPSLVEVVKACIEGGKRIDPRRTLKSVSERDRKVVAKMALIATQPDSFSGAQKMTKAEGRAAMRYTDKLRGEFDGIANVDEKAALVQRIGQLDRAFEAETAVGAQLEIRRAGYNAARLTAILESDQDRARRCLCFGMFPTCPPELGDPPFHVPVACLRGDVSQNGMFLQQVCMFACRKQAMTWRSVNYVIQDWRERLAQNLARYCCADGKDALVGTTGGGMRNVFKYDPELGRGTIAEFAQRTAVLDGVIGEGIKFSKAFVSRPDVGDLTIEAARDVVSGLGADVVKTVEISDEKAVDLIVEKAGGDAIDILAGRDNFEPGDKVAILTQGGKARGYVVVERGGGKFLFTTESEKKIGRRPTPLAGLSAERIARIGELAEKLKTVTDAEIRIDTKITDLAKTRDNLLSDVERLKVETAALAENRKAARREISAANEEFRKLADAQRKSVVVLNRARAELAKAETRKEEFVKVMRSNQPVATLGISQAAKARLAAKNIFTVEEALKSSGALGLSPNQLRSLNNRLTRFVKTGKR